MRSILAFAFLFVLGAESSADSPYKTLSTEWQPDRCLDIVRDDRNNNQPILADCDNVSGQHWKITPAGRGFFKLTTEWHGDRWCLDIVNDGAANNRPVLARCRNVGGQRWRITPAGQGYVRLSTEWRGDGMCLDIVNDGTNRQPVLAACADVSGQRWKRGRI